uniref:Calcium release-activated calcium channel protein 1 n=1 Tax=Globisporangium ultimum (strain ATCC 200006 / CBS 805.95 / DAOM BR144) TaxID=431595 RepID=K3XA37_GLOUD
MAAVGAVVEAVFGSYDLKNAKQWRDEDLTHREQEKQWREDAILRELAWRNADLERERRVLKLENEKRIIDARHRQLTAVGQLSALLAGFSITSMVEIKLPDDVSHPLLVAYGAACCLVFIFMLISMLTCTLLLLAVTRFVTHTLEGEVRELTTLELDLVSPFHAWWLRRCEREWLLAYKCFRLGASLFLLEVTLIGWVVFGRSNATTITMTVVCVVGFLYYQTRVASRWRYLVDFPDPSISSSATYSDQAPQ